jgi:hypothetical protein
MSISLSDFKCLDFDFLKTSLKCFLIPDLTNIFLSYLEPEGKRLSSSIMSVIDIGHVKHVRNSNDFNFIGEDIYLLIDYFIFIVCFTGHTNRFYYVAKLKNKKYIVIMYSDDCVKYCIKTNIYELFVWSENENFCFPYDPKSYKNSIYDIIYGSYFM